MIIKILKFIIRTNWVLLIVIPFILCILWAGLFLNYLEKRNEGFLVLTQPHGTNEYNNSNFEEIHKGSRVSGSFKAFENRLGIVAVRFNTFYRINDDVLIFRIKESNAQNWYYENFYKVDQFQPHQYFTFGFPIIENSSSKQYSFEIESTNGSLGDAVALSTIEPVFVSKYQQSKIEVTKNPINLSVFLFKKTVNSFQDIELFFTFIIYSYPLVFYLIWYLFIRKYLNLYLSRHIRKSNLSVVFIGLILIGIFADILVIKSVNFMLIVVLISLWIITTRALKLASDFTLLLCLVMLGISVIAVILNIEVVPYKSYRWMYVLFTLGYVLKLVEYKTQSKSLITGKMVIDILRYGKRK